MRAALLVLILSLGLPSFAAAKKVATPACTSHCETTYQLCKSRTATSKAKKSCKAVNKSCKKGCSTGR
jgi:hypothetical protein